MNLVPTLTEVIKKAMLEANTPEVGAELAAERIDELIQLSIKDLFGPKD